MARFDLLLLLTVSSQLLQASLHTAINRSTIVVGKSAARVLAWGLLDEFVEFRQFMDHHLLSSAVFTGQERAEMSQVMEFTF